MTCTFAKPPLNLDEWLALVDRCATSVGGEGWERLALMGVLVVVAAGFAVLALAGLVRAAR